MPTESELRAQLHAGDREPAGDIDLDAVLHGARARRRPRTIALTAVASLAVVGIVVPVAIGIAGPQNGLFSTSSGSGSAASAPEAVTGGQDDKAGGSTANGSAGASGGTQNRCGARLATPAPASNGLVLAVQPVDAAAGGSGIPVTVTLTNTGSTAFHGYATPYPTLTLSQDGVVVWHSNGAVPSIAQVIDLAPGASTAFSTTFDAAECASADETRGSFPGNLPAASAGSYQLSATLAVSSDAGGSVLAFSPAAEVTLR